jgi:hypothetical protein
VGAAGAVVGGCIVCGAVNGGAATFAAAADPLAPARWGWLAAGGDVVTIGRALVVTVGTGAWGTTVENVNTTGGAVGTYTRTGVVVGVVLVSVTFAASLEMCRPRPMTAAPNSAPAAQLATMVVRRTRLSGLAFRTAAPTIFAVPFANARSRGS